MRFALFALFAIGLIANIVLTYVAVWIEGDAEQIIRTIFINCFVLALIGCAAIFSGHMPGDR